MSHLELLGALPDHEVAALLDVDTKTLANWRSKNAGPAYSRAGGVILYPVSGLREWVETNIIVPRPVVSALTESPPKRGPGRPRKGAAADQVPA
jgi:hypothetical protein